MKQNTILLSAALVAALGGLAWLVMENSRLRTELAEMPAQKIPVRTVRNVTGSGTAGGQQDPTASPAAKKPGAATGAGSRDVAASGTPEAAAAIRGALRVADNGDGTFTVSDSASPWLRVMTAQQLRELSQTMDSTMQAAVTKFPGGPSWSPGRAAGAPDTPDHGDHATAWASQTPDGGREWLQLKYPKSVEVREINIHETYNPGALSKVSAIMPDGSERVIWEGTEDPDNGMVERAVKVPPGIRSDQIRIELDTSRVPGWNEIDAVEMVGADGSRQWAAESTASSHYGQGRGIATLTSEETVIFLGPQMVKEALPARQ